MAITEDKVSQYLDGMDDSLFDNTTHSDIQEEKKESTSSATVIPNNDVSLELGTQFSSLEKAEGEKTVAQDLSYDDIKVVRVRKYRLYKKG